MGSGKAYLTCLDKEGTGISVLHSMGGSVGLSANGPLLSQEPSQRGSPRRTTAQKTVIIATTTIKILVVIVANEGRREIPLKYSYLEH